MEDKRFAVFILTHGRARTISTHEALRSCGYTGDIFIVIDTDDDDEPLYREKFGDSVIQFNKEDYIAKTDLGDTEHNMKIGVFARNFIQDVAKEMGYRFHLQLDDDIHGFETRYIDHGRLRAKMISHMDGIFDAMLTYMEETPITSLSFGLQAYLIGGAGNNAWAAQMIPKTMTTFLMRADDVRYFNMRMNDDITTSALNGSRGKLYYSIVPLQLVVDGTQVQAGGMTEIYQDNGTYRKSFYTVMALPSCTKVSAMGITDYRIHHEIKWNNCVPKLISDNYRKKRGA